MSKRKIGFAGRWDPLDKNSWSGTYHYAYKQLLHYGTVDIFHFDYPTHLKNYLISFYKNPQEWFFNKNVAVEFLRPYAKYFSKQLEKELLKRKADVLFVPAAPQLIAYADTKLPIIFMTDATFAQIQGYYDTWENFSPSNIKQGIGVDKLAFKKAAHCMLASDWCKQSAMHDYGLNEHKISVVPLGANLDKAPLVKEINFESNTCNLLFLGVEWKRKGGDIALQAFRLLKQKKIKVTLHIIGCTPPEPIKEKGVTVIPFLDKNNPAEFEKLHNIFLNTDFLLLPTRAEAAGIVFCEAAAYGIPSFTTNTGGVSTYVRNGINGYTFDAAEDGHAYAEKILETYTNPEQMKNLKQSSRKLYDQTLNWDAWGKAFGTIMSKL
jgi:glycosyltransferase involved in cell wall biosynthesis